MGNNNLMHIYLDLLISFDTIDHNILLKKEHYGITGTALSLFLKLFNWHRQYVVYDKGKSDFADINLLRQESHKDQY